MSGTRGEIMNAQQQIIEIDHVVFEGLGITPERAERIRMRIELELQGRILQGDLDRVASGDLPLLTPPLLPDLPASDQQVAELLVERIMQSLRYVELSGVE